MKGLVQTKVYLVIAYRYGVVKDYSYPIGVFTSEDEAISAAKAHRNFRGGKYDHKMFYVDLNTGYDAEEAKGVWVTNVGSH